MVSVSLKGNVYNEKKNEFNFKNPLQTVKIIIRAKKNRKDKVIRSKTVNYH